MYCVLLGRNRYTDTAAGSLRVEPELPEKKL
jgi:hypothetical protein